MYIINYIKKQAVPLLSADTKKKKVLWQSIFLRQNLKEKLIREESVMGSLCFLRVMNKVTDVGNLLNIHL